MLAVFDQSISDNVVQRTLGAESADSIIDLCKEESGSLVSDRARGAFWSEVAIYALARLGYPEEKTRDRIRQDRGFTSGPKAVSLGNGGEEYAEELSAVLALAVQIRENCNQVTGRGADFAASVYEKVEEISNTIAETCRVTDNQMEAMTNMSEAIDKWIKD